MLPKGSRLLQQTIAICFLSGAVLAFIPESVADFLDDANQALTLRAFNDKLQMQLSGTLDLEGYYLDQPPPGLLFAGQHYLFNPRLTLYLDAQLGSHLYSFVQARFDRGFDPTDHNTQVRLDEYALRLRPWETNNLSLQAGKFGTVVGNWVPRHYSWDNPFVNAPLPYENLTGIWDSDGVADVDELLDWGHVPHDGITHFGDGYTDKKWRLPVIWGPSYATGVSLAGSLGKFDYAVEVKNASLSSRPASWDLTNVGFEHPTFSGRIGVTPSAMWNAGFSGSIGPYLVAGAEVPVGHAIDDYREIVIGQDLSFAWHKWQLWAEIFENRFEVPNVGDADLLSYYIEAKYKITAQLFAALRWNQQLYGDVPDDDQEVRWGNNLSRVDLAVGYRFTNYLQTKLQYSFNAYRDPDVNEGEQVMAVQFTLRF